MAKDVKFNIKLQIDGKEQVVTATTSVQGLAKELGIAKIKGEEVRASLINFNQVTQTFQNVLSSIQQLTGVMGQFSAANDLQIEAETQLANNMRNTMAAREADIQSIKDLCSAQQQLGVIGDEVQLSGAQELATYLEKKSSLEKLIPVMNDMLAQQYGLNATQESAASIATMLGKVMNGQVSALSRYGYTFNEVQAQILQFGTEEERAAILADVVSASVGGMNAELAKTDSGKAKQMANAIGDLKEQFGALYSRIQPVITSISEMGMALASMTIAGTGLKKGISSIREAAAALKALSLTEITFGSTTTAATVATTGLTAAIGALGSVLGIGVAIAGITALLSSFWDKSDEGTESLKKLKEETQRLNQAEQAQAASLTQTRSALQLNIAKLKEFHGSKQEEKKIVEEMNNTYGETMGYFSSVSGWYEALTKNSEKYCRQMVAEAKARSLANQIANLEEENRTIGQNIVNDKYSRENEKETRVVNSGTTSYGTVSTYTIKVDIEGTSELDKARDQMQENYRQIDDMKQRMEDSLKEAASIQYDIIGSSVRPNANANTTAGVTKDTQLSLIENANTYKDLANNISYYQQEIEKTNVEDRGRINILMQQKKAAEDLLNFYKKGSQATNSLIIVPKIEPVKMKDLPSVAPKPIKMGDVL